MSDRLAEIRARLDAATPGPWAVMYRGTPHCVVVKSLDQNPDEGRSWWVMAWPRGRKRDALAQPAMDNNADLIAHAPADIAWLLEEVDNLNRTLNEWMTFCGSKECSLQRKAGAK